MMFVTTTWMDYYHASVTLLDVANLKMCKKDNKTVILQDNFAKT